MMIEISNAKFHIKCEHLRDGELELYANKLFEEFDIAASKLIPLADYGIHLDIESGSIKGRGKILATATVLYIGIANFGSFVQGIREISSIGKSVALGF